MTQQELQEFEKQWLNGVGVGYLWEKNKAAFLSGLHNQTATTTVAWKQQARANIDLNIGVNQIWYGSAANTIGLLNTSSIGRAALNTDGTSAVEDFWAEKATKDGGNNTIVTHYAHSLEFVALSSRTILRLKSSDATALSELDINYGSGLVRLAEGKIPLSVIPDAILGQLTYGGSIDAYDNTSVSGVEFLVASMTNSAKAILAQRTGKTFGTKEVRLVATSSKPSDTSSVLYFNYADCKGIYFIWTAAALESHTGEPDYRIWPTGTGNPRYQSGDWLTTNEQEWKKIDNTDAVTGVKGVMQSAYQLGNVSLDALNVGALATYATQSGQQEVADKVQFADSIWSLKGIAAGGMVNLSPTGGGGSGTTSAVRITADGVIYESVDGVVTIATPTISDQPDGTVSLGGVALPVKGLGTFAFISTLSLDDLTDAADIQAIEALTGTGILKRTGDGTWALRDAAGVRSDAGITGDLYTHNYSEVVTAVSISGANLSVTKGNGSAATTAINAATLESHAASYFATASDLDDLEAFFDSNGELLPAHLCKATTSSIGGIKVADPFTVDSNGVLGIGNSKITNAMLTSAGKFKIGTQNIELGQEYTQANWRSYLGLGTASTHAHEDYVTNVSWDSTNLKLKQSKGGGTAADVVQFGAAALKAVDTSITASSTSTNLPTSKAVADMVAEAYLPLSGGTISNNTNVTTPLIIRNSYNGATEIGVRFDLVQGSKGWVGYSGSSVMLYNYARAKSLAYKDNGVLEFEGNTVWHEGNDGTGSGLDADKLDGYEAAGLFESMVNDNEQLKIQIGNTSKSLTLDYANLALDAKTELKQSQTITYRQTGGGTLTKPYSSGVIKRVLGNSVVWNQRIRDYEDYTAGSIDYTNCSVSYSNGIATITGNTGNSNFSLRRNGANAVVGHRYYHRIVYKSTIGVTPYESGGSGAFGTLQISDTFRIYTGLFTNNYATGTTGFGFYINNATATWEFQLKMAISIDLTLFFNGNIPTDLTAETFERDYGYLLANPEYNAGTLINNACSGLESTGFNLWDEEWEVGVYNLNTGVKENGASTQIRCKNKIAVEPNKTYYFKNATSLIWAVCYHQDGSYAARINSGYSFGNATITIPSDVYYIAFWTQSTYGGTYNNDICINRSDSSKNGTYEPYRKNTLPLHLNSFRVKDAHGNISTINGLKKAGSVYDEIVGKKLIQRLAEIDLGDYNWNEQFALQFNIFHASSVTNGKASSQINSVCSIYYGISTPQFVDMPNKTCYISGTYGVVIKDASFAGYTGSQVKTALAGVKLNYELTTPIEYEIIDDFPTSYPIDVLGTESIPEGEMVAPFIGDIQYGAKQNDFAWDIDHLANVLRGIKLSSGAFSDATVSTAANNGEWYELETSEYDKLFVRFVTSDTAYKLQIANAKTNPTLSREFEFGTLDQNAIDAICV